MSTVEDTPCKMPAKGQGLMRVYIEKPDRKSDGSSVPTLGSVKSGLRS